VAALLPFHLHPVLLVLIVGAGVVHHVVVSSARQRRLALYALLALLIVTMWPIGDLAASVSLSVATGQRLVIMLLVAPLLLLSVPTELLGRLTRPAPIDFCARKLAKPGVAIVIVTVVGTATLASPVVDWGARSNVGRGIIIATVLCLGFLLWIPALAVLPGTHRLSPAARAGYIFASPNTPSIPGCTTKKRCCTSRHSSISNWRGSSPNSVVTFPCGRWPSLSSFTRKTRARPSRKRRCTGPMWSENFCASIANAPVRFATTDPPSKLFGRIALHGDVAQLVERGLCKPEVVGSIPIVSTTGNGLFVYYFGSSVSLWPRFPCLTTRPGLGSSVTVASGRVSRSVASVPLSHPFHWAH
jgi:hypothetical protein